MIYYAMLLGAAILFSLQFLFNKKFEEECGSSLAASMLFSFISSVAGIVFLFAADGFKIEFSWFSLLWAAVYATNGILFNVASVKSFKSVNLSAYSIFSMLGGMLLPSVYGIAFCGEKFTLFMAICFALIVLALIFTVDFKQKLGNCAWYVAVFVLNGLFGVLSVIHQSNSAQAVDSSSFLILARIVSAVICAAFCFGIKGTFKKTSKKSVFYSCGFAVLSSFGNLLVLLSLKHLPASVQYPMITGGVVIISLLISILRKEKVNLRNIIATVVAFLATMMLAL